MRRIFVPAFRSSIILFILCLPALLQGPSLAAQLSTESIKPSLVTVTAYDATGKIIATGAGFFVRDNVVATAYAIIKDARSIKLSTSRSDSVAGWLFAVDGNRLLALIHADGTTSPPLLTASAASSAAGQSTMSVSVAATGEPEMLQVTVSASGKNAPQMRVDSGGRQLIAGSPILNENGRIAAIITDPTYAVSVQSLNSLMNMALNAVPGTATQSLAMALPGNQVEVTSTGKAKDSSSLKGGQLIRSVEPAYPAALKTAGIGGSVSVQVTVDDQGYVTGVKSISGEPSLQGAAAAAAMAFLYAPTMDNNSPVGVTRTIKFNFNPGIAQSGTPAGKPSNDLARHEANVKSNPTDEAAVLSLGKSYFVQNRFQDALKQFGTAISLAPNDPVAFYELGTAYVALRDYNDAIGSLSQAVTLKPDYLEALGLLATAYNQNGLYDDAIPVCEQILNIEPRNAEAYHNLGWAYGGLHRFQDGITAYRTEIEIRPYYAGAHYGLGVMYASVRAYDAAKQELSKAIQINPAMADAHYRLGLAYVSTGDLNSANKELASLNAQGSPLAEQLDQAIRQNFPPPSR